MVDCCIGIPIYFTDLQRRAVLDAATIAGLHPLSLLHKTTATALVYGIYKTDLPENDQLNVIFVDIGHAGMQVCIAGLKKGQLKILAHAFDRSLGGRDFDEDHREVALILFNSLTEIIGNSFQPHFADLQSLLLKSLQDETSTRVRVAALKSVGSFLEFTHNEVEVIKLREFIPSILNVSRQCLASSDEDVTVIAFEIFDKLIESPAPLLGESVRSIVQFSLEVCSSAN